MDVFFDELIRNARRISRDDFARDFGGVDQAVVDMLGSEAAQRVLRRARESIEARDALPNGHAALWRVEFGRFNDAPELARGEVAAVDGTPTLPVQIYSAGQTLCVGIGSVSHRRGFEQSCHHWSSSAHLGSGENTAQYLRQLQEGVEQVVKGVSPTAFMRYFEVTHALEINEPLILFDGPVVYEWLLATREGLACYDRLFHSGKRCVGVTKSLKANPLHAWLGRALRPGEIFVNETLAEHFAQRTANFLPSRFKRDVAPRIVRGVFKPRHKAFGFEVHEDALDDMLRIVAADAQMNCPGHEVPYLLNLVDQEVRGYFRQGLLRDRIAGRLAQNSDAVFFEEGHERDFRAEKMA